jgi:hypothetical protein
MAMTIKAAIKALGIKRIVMADDKCPQRAR